MLNGETILQETALKLYNIKHQIIDAFFKYGPVIMVVLKFNGVEMVLYVPNNDF